MCCACCCAMNDLGAHHAYNLESCFRNKNVRIELIFLIRTLKFFCRALCVVFSFASLFFGFLTTNIPWLKSSDTESPITMTRKRTLRTYLESPRRIWTQALAMSWLWTTCPSWMSPSTLNLSMLSTEFSVILGNWLQKASTCLLTTPKILKGI